MKTLFSGIVTSKIRIKILMRLFLNPSRHAYLRELSDEFSVSPSHVKEELGQLCEGGLLKSEKNGRQILFSANQQHPVFHELHSMVKKSLGMDRILDRIINRLGNLEKAILLDDYAEGKDSGLIDLLLIGDVDQANLLDLTKKTEQYIGRKIRVLVLSEKEHDLLRNNLDGRPSFLLWERKNYG